MRDQKENQWNINLRCSSFSKRTKENHKWHTVSSQRGKKRTFIILIYQGKVKMEFNHESVCC